MSLAQLPIELQRLIAEQVVSEGDMNAFAQTNHTFYEICNSLLYRHNVEHSHCSSLFWAALKGRLRTLELALAAGADLDAPRPNGMTPLLQAVTCEHENIVRFLLKNGADPERNMSSLVMAALVGSDDIVQLLLESNANADTVDGDYRTALAYAAQNGSLRSIKLLLDAGADVNFADREGNSPLHWAEVFFAHDAVDMLLDAGADMQHGIEDRTPLSIAVERGYKRTIAVILASRPEPEGPSPPGSTPLHWAVWNRDVETAEALLEAGYDPGTLSDQGTSAMQLARLTKYDTMIELLSKYETGNE